MQSQNLGMLNNFFFLLFKNTFGVKWGDFTNNEGI
jgi:hypothetical protein